MSNHCVRGIEKSCFLINASYQEKTMILKIRRIIAFNLSVFLMFVSFGFIKPNFSGKSIVPGAIFKNKAVISLDADKENKMDDQEF